jgi:hypothetical protein
MTGQPVPVSGEDQPDPRLAVLVERFELYWPNVGTTAHVDLARRWLRLLDAADRAAGIRRVKWPEQQEAEVGAWWTAEKRSGEGTAHEIAGFEGDPPTPPTDNFPRYDLRLWVGRCGVKAPLLFSSAATVESPRCESCVGGGS